MTQGVRLTDTRKLTAEYKRNSTENVQVNINLNRLQELSRNLNEAVKGFDGYFSSIMFCRATQDTVTIKDMFHHVGAFFRGLFDKAEVECEVNPGRIFFLTLTDTVQAAGFVFRGLLLSVRIITQVFIRDYLLSRFLKARQVIELKSAVCRELILESKL